MKLAYHHFGNGNPLIILHGLYGSGDNWYSIARNLGGNFEIFLVDLRNHGASPHSSEISNSLMSSDLEEFFIDRNIHKASIIGHSMGGKIALNFTLQNPEKVSKLVVVDVALRSYKSESSFSSEIKLHRKIIDSLNSLDISGPKTRNDIDKQLSESLSQKTLRDFLLKNLKRRPTGEFYWALNIEALRNHIQNILEAVETRGKVFKEPVLLIVGKQSDYVISEDYPLFREVFPELKIEEFDTGHWVHAEQPEKMIRILDNFLQN